MANKRSTLSDIIFEKFEEPPWPSFVKPLPDEVFTSWLLRMSRSHLVRYYTFCSSYFDGIEFWNRDLDKALPEEIKAMIIKKTILKASDIQEMLLSSYHSKIFVNDLGKRNPWFTPFSVYNYKYAAKHQTTLSVCTSCLKNDNAVPYYRKQWRLSIQTICTTCKTEMIDACPECGSQINHLISEKGRKSQTPIFPITYCWKCLYDLQKSETRKPSLHLLDMQGYLNQVIESGHDIAHSLQYSHLYFITLHKVISLLNKTNNEPLKRFQELLCQGTDLEFIAPIDNRKNPFELMKISVRRNLLYKAYWVLADWPYRFRELTAKAGVRSKVFTDDFHDIPYWFQTEIANNRLVHAEWRKAFPEYNYGSFKELATWRASKIGNNKDPNKKRGLF